jgi:hypothetical protein
MHQKRFMSLSAEPVITEMLRKRGKLFWIDVFTQDDNKIERKKEKKSLKRFRLHLNQLSAKKLWDFESIRCEERMIRWLRC